MNQPPTNRDQAIWQRFIESYIAQATASREFLAEGVDRVALVREALKSRSSNQQAAAIYIAHWMKPAELQELFSEWLALSRSHGYAGVMREIIKSLPRDWVLAHIEAVAEPFLSSDDPYIWDDYRRLLELYNELDRELTLRLAHRAVAHADPDVREAGEDFLEILGVTRDSES